MPHWQRPANGRAQDVSTVDAGLLPATGQIIPLVWGSNMAQQPIWPCQQRLQQWVLIYAGLKALKLHDIVDATIQKIPSRLVLGTVIAKPE